MSIRVISNNEIAALYDSVTDWSFGPVFYSHRQHDAEQRAENFLSWHKRKHGDNKPLKDVVVLMAAYSEWLALEAGAHPDDCFWCDEMILPGELYTTIVDGEPCSARHCDCAGKHGERVDDEDVQECQGKECDGAAMTSPGTKRAIVAMLPELHARGYQVVEGEIGISIVQSDYREHTDVEKQQQGEEIERMACSEE